VRKSSQFRAYGTMLLLTAAAIPLAVESTEAQEPTCHRVNAHNNPCITAGSLQSSAGTEGSTNYSRTFSNSCPSSIDIYSGDILMGGVPPKALHFIAIPNTTKTVRGNPGTKNARVHHPPMAARRQHIQRIVVFQPTAPTKIHRRHLVPAR
jgi:hypothetical protein